MICVYDNAHATCINTVILYPVRGIINIHFFQITLIRLNIHLHQNVPQEHESEFSNPVNWVRRFFPKLFILHVNRLSVGWNVRKHGLNPSSSSDLRIDRIFRTRAPATHYSISGRRYRAPVQPFSSKSFQPFTILRNQIYLLCHWPQIHRTVNVGRAFVTIRIMN